MVANDTLMSLFHRIDEISPPPTADLDKFFGSNPQLGSLGIKAQNKPKRGGLYDMVSMVVTGLVALHPHMISATITVLSRIFYEFPGQLEDVHM